MYLSPYPLFYSPAGAPKPPCCPHLAPVGCLAGKGPDAFQAADGTWMGGGGLCWGGSLPQPGTVTWTKSPAGWWVVLDGIVPQALRRVTVHPRVMRWLSIPGANPGQRWRVPVLLTSDEQGDPLLAVDRVLTPDGWRESDDLAPLLEPLLAVHGGRRLHEDPAQRNEACTLLAIDLLSLGQWIDRDLAVVTGWITESLVIDALRAAIGQSADIEEGLS